MQAIADEEGLTLTETLAATYLGQSEAGTFQEKQLAAARTEYDPLATTREEAEQFFASTGYTATTKEIAGFVASKTEEVQTSAIGAYVDPRQMTSDEAREFLSAIGYNPTEEEVQQFTGQLNDDNYQVTQQAEIDGYVDPRYVDAGEVRAAYEELGLVDVTQEDVDRFVGQFDEETQLGEVSDYLPTATFNVIKSLMGSPAVEDDPNTDADESKDATGIYAEFEEGATRDEALQGAIDKLTTDLGLTEEAMLQELGLTKEALSGEIDAVASDVEAVQEDVVDLGDQITDVETNLGDQITDVETNLGTDIQAVADLIGKPARDVTQTDVDFVIDLIAQENVSQELTMQYDVTGDGIVDINDQNMLTGALQGDQDAAFADTSMFNPATGLYLQQEQDTQTTQDLVTDLNTQINTQIQTNQREDNINEMMKQLRASSDATGQRVDVDTPDPMNIDYLYDIGGDSVFATPQQAQLFGSPYGGTRAQQPTQTPPNSAIQPRAQRRASGFSEGGQVEDENDMLLRILGDM